MRILRLLGRSLWVVSLVVINGCSLAPEDRQAMDNPWNPPAEEQRQRVTSMNTSQPEAVASLTDGQLEPSATAGRSASNKVDSEPAAPLTETYPGSGTFINLGRAGRTPATSVVEGDITLNFQGTEIGEVVKTVLGDILQENYALDDRVTGPVYLQTSRPIAREALISTLETLLQINGAALVRTHDFYEVVPFDAVPAGALRPRIKLTADRGYQVLIVPLRYISAKEMLKILEPVKPNQGLMEADEHRNLLILAGTQAELINLRETIKIFDVDQLQGMSVGLFRLQSVEADLLVGELERVFGDEADGPLAGMVRFVPIQRLNALLVLTPQKQYLANAKDWIERLDRSDDPRGVSMHVYYVQNGKADNLADLLTQLFDQQQRRRGRQESPSRSEVAAVNQSSAAERTESAGTGVSPRTTGGLSGTSLDVGDVSIIADSENNALLIMASTLDYDKVHKAILKLDVLPLQVLVEATIVEVTLEDELRYGLQWFFKNSFDGKTGRGAVGDFPIPALATSVDIFETASYEVFDAAGTRALLTALANDSKINVISSPSLMVLDNHTASIRVGDQVPVRTSETTNTSSGTSGTTPTQPSALVTSTIQFRDTGVLLEVTPRVNAGGMVVLDIKQEVNDVDATTTSGIDSPTITQRLINTTVAVQSGETLVLGGLIEESKTDESSGVPVLRHIPILGWLFSGTGKATKRTELVVLITPKAVLDREDAREVTREYRNKLQGVTFPDEAALEGDTPES